MLAQRKNRWVGPVQVGDRQHHRTVTQPGFEHRCDGVRYAIARDGGINLVEFRRSTQQMQQRLRELGTSRHIGVAEQFGQEHVGGIAQTSEIGRCVEVEMIEQSGCDRPPHVGLAVRNRVALHDKSRLGLAGRLKQFVDDAALADTALTVDSNQGGLRVHEGEVDRRLHQRKLGGATHHRHVTPTHSGSGLRYCRNC